MTEWGGEPAYIRVLTDLRAKIESGEIPPGAAIPSVANLASTHGVAATTVQKAIRALKGAGLVDSRPGKGVFVREVKLRVSRSADFVSPVPDGGKTPHGKSRPVEIDEVEPPDDVAEKLDIDLGEKVVRRRRVMVDEHDDALEITVSYIPMSVAKGTPLERSTKLRGAMPTALKRLGFPPRDSREWVTGRMPTSDEARTLKIPSGTPVLRTLRVTWTDNGRPVEALEIVFSAGRFMLEYDLPIQDA